MTSSDTHSAAFVGCDDMVACMIGDIGAEILQQRIGHTCVEVDAVSCQLLIEKRCTYHYFVPGINSNISLIGIHSGFASNERSFCRILSAHFIMAG